MKTKYIFIIVLLLIISIIIIGALIKKNKPTRNIEISNIKHLGFGYSDGYTMYGRVRYEVDYEEDGYKVTILPRNIADEDKLEVKVDKEVIEKIEKVLTENNVSKWNGFDETDKDVLDGNSFSFYLKMQNGETIEASGYMKWPENYGKVKKELDDIFMDIYDKNGGKKSEE